MNLLKSSSKFSKKQIILLSIPVFFSNLAIPLVGMVDTGLMGNLGETKYLAATSVATTVMTMIVWSFGFLRMGTVGIVSQAYGRSDYREIVKTLLRNMIIALIVAFFIFHNIQSGKFKILFIHSFEVSYSVFFGLQDKIVQDLINYFCHSVPCFLYTLDFFNGAKLCFIDLH